MQVWHFSYCIILVKIEHTVGATELHVVAIVVTLEVTVEDVCKRNCTKYPVIMGACILRSWVQSHSSSHAS